MSGQMGADLVGIRFGQNLFDGDERHVDGAEQGDGPAPRGLRNRVVAVPRDPVDLFGDQQLETVVEPQRLDAEPRYLRELTDLSSSVTDSPPLPFLLRAGLPKSEPRSPNGAPTGAKAPNGSPDPSLALPSSSRSP